MSYIILFYFLVIVSLLSRMYTEKDYLLEITVTKALLFGACSNTYKNEEGEDELTSFQICLGPVVLTLTYDAD